MKNKVRTIALGMFPGHEKQVEELIPFLQFEKYKAGQLLVNEGEMLPYVGFVLKGVLRKFYRNNSKDGQTLYFTFEGSVVAEMQSLLHNRPAIYCIQAVEDCDLVTIPCNQLETLCSRFPFLESLSARQLEKIYMQELERLINSGSHTAECRYKEMLLRQPDIIMRVPGHYIASYLGIRPES